MILAGGTASRLGGVAKPQLEVGGVTLLDRVVAACAGAGRIIVVGPAQPVAVEVSWAREDPPGGGPVAGLAAAAPYVTAPVVLTLAADLPGIAPAVAELLASVPADGVAALATAGRTNYLAAAWRTASLRAALAGLVPAGASMRSLFDGVPLVAVGDTEGRGRDIDTWDDVDRARQDALN